MQQTNKRYLFQKWSCQTSWYLLRAISVKGISIKGSWSQFNLIFCCCLNSAINSPTYPPHSFSDASHGTLQRVCETYRFRNWPYLPFYNVCKIHDLGRYISNTFFAFMKLTCFERLTLLSSTNWNSVWWRWSVVLSYFELYVALYSTCRILQYLWHFVIKLSQLFDKKLSHFVIPVALCHNIFSQLSNEIKSQPVIKKAATLCNNIRRTL